MRDHPGMGGEEISIRSVYQSFQGSPPRRRGKADKDDVSGLDLGITPAGRGKELVPTRGFGFKRITPAWAGKSQFHGACQCPSWDHPRVGGEKILEPSMGVGNFGSPPRGRGKADVLVVKLQLPGIIPAWAGKSRTSGGRKLLARDHPRMGGEKAVALFRTSKASGSPPRERGKGKARNAVTHQLRITPAWAGKRAYCRALGARD